jgi:ABC-2 type transport system permease protein
VALVIVLGAVIGSAAGLLLGTILQPAKIRAMFSLLITPLIFTGASQYPWPALREIPWFRVVTALNPITYVSEALRATLTPSVPHIDIGVSLIVLFLFLTILVAAGAATFRRRAIT